MKRDNFKPRKIWYLFLTTFNFIFPNALYLKLLYRLMMGKPLNLKKPKSFTEKIQWLKLFDKHDEYTQLVDKYAVKDIVAKIIGQEHIIPTIGVWDNVDDIDWESLPQQFVLKTTHGGGGGGVVICRNKQTFDKKKALKKLRFSMARNASGKYREYPYYNVPHRIIAEQYIEENNETHDVNDYKVFNFHGKPYLIQVDFDRFVGHKKNLYDITWNLLPFSFNYPTHPEIQIPRPKVLDEMLVLAAKLSATFPFVRTDFYIIGDKIYFGELTFFPASGLGKFEPDEWDERLGELIKLSKCNEAK